MPRKKSGTADPQPGSLELTEQLIRERAYVFYEQRGRDDGHDVEDWLKAEAEIIGKKSSQPEPAPEVTASSAAAA
jgi:hypothetical protein